jgi:hypothetical protein
MSRRDRARDLTHPRAQGRHAPEQDELLGKMPVTYFADFAWYEGDPGFDKIAGCHWCNVAVGGWPEPRCWHLAARTLLEQGLRPLPKPVTDTTGADD